MNNSKEAPILAWPEVRVSILIFLWVAHSSVWTSENFHGSSRQIGHNKKVKWAISSPLDVIGITPQETGRMSYLILLQSWIFQSNSSKLNSTLNMHKSVFCNSVLSTYIQFFKVYSKYYFMSVCLHPKSFVSFHPNLKIDAKLASSQHVIDGVATILL